MRINRSTAHAYSYTGSAVSRRRILALLSLLAIGIACGLAAFRSREARQVDLLIADKRDQQSEHMRRIVDLMGRKLETFADDYTFWDDMVAFVANPDPEWAKDNLETGLSTFGATHVWLHDKGLREVYSLASDEAPWKGAFPGSIEELCGVLDKKHLVHGFVTAGDQLIELQCASIHATQDVDRKGEIFGYLIVGQLWDEHHIAEIRELSDCGVGVDVVRSGSDAAVEGPKSFVMPLKDWGDRVVAHLRVKFSSATIELLDKSTEKAIEMTALSALLVMSVMTLCLLRWVNAPLRAISRSLQTESPVHLGRLLSAPGEFGDVARMIKNFFKHKGELVKEVERRTKLQDELAVARDQALEAMRGKSHLLATMSHEVRNPLGGVLGMATHLCDTPLDDEQRDSVNAIQRSCGNLLEILNDVLEMSRVESGQVRAESLDFDLRQVVEDVIELFAPRARQSGIDLVACIEPGLPYRLRGDPLRFRQVVTNLVSNAVKFTERGEVVVEVSVLERSEQVVMARFCVRDTGIGVPLDRHATIFEDYAQGESSIARRYGGSGLGLSICKRLVELMSGKMGLESEPGKGSSFWFEMPFAVSNEGSIEEAERDGLAGTKTGLLVSHDASRRSIRWKLEELECEVQEASDVAGLFDVERREVDGHERVWIVDESFAREIRERCARAGESPAPPKLIELVTHSVATSASTRTRRRLLKPVRMALLRHVLKETLGKIVVRSDSDVGSKVSPVRFSGCRVLLVEDEPLNQRVMRRMLEKLDCSVEVAASGRIALELLGLRSFDLVLMDCNMPELDGYETTRVIRDGAAGCSRVLPIFALTGSVDGDVVQRCRQAGMDEVHCKPLSFEKLIDLLGRVAPPRLSTPTSDPKS